MEKMASLTWPTDRLSAQIERQHEAIMRMTAPFEAIAKQVQALGRAISFPNSIVDQMQRAVADYQRILPNLGVQFALSKSVIDSLQGLNLVVPDYLATQGQLAAILQSRTHEFYSSFRNLTDLVQSTTISPDATMAVVSRPSLSVATHNRGLRILRLNQDEPEVELESTVDELDQLDAESARRLINTVNPSWLTLIEGAEHSLRSDNPDRVRHAATSLRELVTQIIHTLAPDDLVHERLTEQHWFHNGRPTRKARLFFILTKKYGNDVLVDFIEKDIDAILSFFDLFQRGTHEIVSTIDSKELQFIVTRTRLLVTQLIGET